MKIKGDHMKAKAHNDSSVWNRKIIMYMEKLDSILGHRPASQPPVVLQRSQLETNFETI